MYTQFYRSYLPFYDTYATEPDGEAKQDHLDENFEVITSTLVDKNKVNEYTRTFLELLAFSVEHDVTDELFEIVTELEDILESFEDENGNRINDQLQENLEFHQNCIGTVYILLNGKRKGIVYRRPVEDTNRSTDVCSILTTSTIVGFFLWASWATLYLATASN